MFCFPCKWRRWDGERFWWDGWKGGFSSDGAVQHKVKMLCGPHFWVKAFSFDGLSTAEVLNATWMSISAREDRKRSTLVNCAWLFHESMNGILNFVNNSSGKVPAIKILKIMHIHLKCGIFKWIYHPKLKCCYHWPYTCHKHFSFLIKE